MKKAVAFPYLTKNFIFRSDQELQNITQNFNTHNSKASSGSDYLAYQYFLNDLRGGSTHLGISDFQGMFSFLLASNLLHDEGSTIRFFSIWSILGSFSI